MKLHHKLALYNIITKVAIITICGLVVIALTDNISLNHMQRRLMDKRNKLITNLSQTEINDLVNLQKTFTDYNILKEEYIILNKVSHSPKKETELYFTQAYRQVDNESQRYLIMTDYFTYKNKIFRLELGETLEYLSQLEKTLLYFSLITMIISVIISLVVDIGFTRFLLTPFYQIIDKKLNNVNDPIHYNYTRIKTSTQDFKLLDESISTLMKKISGQIITQKQFISNVSHELLTPLSLLMSRLENLLNDEKLSDHGMNKIVSSLKTLRRLKSIIHSLLLISKIEHNQYDKNDVISICAVVEEIYEELEDRLVERNISFTNKVTQKFKLVGNETLVHILCTNLINNAIKYNKTNGHVIISDLLTLDAYYLYIKDEGIGMNFEEINLAFSRYEKLGTTEADSHGLGLAIVKSIAAFHNIAIHIDSEKNIGTCVTLKFPLQGLPGDTLDQL